jgi:alpha-galactosidase
MCLSSPYKQYVLNTLSEAVGQYDLKYIKLDLTTMFNAYGEEPPGCYETGHEHASAAESNVRIYEALGWIADQLHHRYPDLLIDFTFELWGEKQLIDYGLLHVADLDWISNVPDGSTSSVGPLQARTVLYQRAMVIPTEDMLVGALQIDTPPWQERVATAMASAPVLLGDPRKVSDADAKAIGDWIRRFEKLREQVALNESFFPLGSWRQPRINAWDGYGRFARTGEGLIAVFANESNATQATIAIPGFPDGHYRATDWSTDLSFNLEGSELRNGWTLPLTGKPRVRVLEVRKR